LIFFCVPTVACKLDLYFLPYYRSVQMPYHQLIPKFRQLLESLHSQAVRLESSWMASSLVSERGVSPVNPKSKQIRGRPDCQSDRPGMNKGQSIEDRESPDWSQWALAGRDSTPDNQFSHRRPTADAAVQIPHADPITKPYRPAPKPTATADKPHHTWKAELMVGMACNTRFLQRSTFRTPSRAFSLPTL